MKVSHQWNLIRMVHTVTDDWKDDLFRVPDQDESLGIDCGDEQW